MNRTVVSSSEISDIWNVYQTRIWIFSQYNSACSSNLQFPFQQGQYEMERNDSAFESVDIDYGELDDEKRTPTPEPTRSPPKVKKKEMNLKKNIFNKP